ncbi:type 1 glutamine amidotransferase domain-containing protein [Halobacillus sp. Marseille-Q1614]|uniref:type 1 glutamine amidotransferase domain-containing protein n=1 Tax=Halobacillus sp. Marseille-Q1614 TaxID=2709134 RepID=UPI00156DA1A7|nr:type 1 glutamine amidotransferase domain-containing protein [Halobacillus sp. Marseille-Q1614]
MKKILMVVTNAEKLNDRETGLWLSEFVEPSTEWRDSGFEITAASIKGGKIPIDPNSYTNELPRVWDGVMEPINDTKKLSEVNPEYYDAIFFCGGHGAVVDFPNNKEIESLIAHFSKNKKLIGSICHGPAAFVGTKGEDGQTFINGVKMTGFSNKEEKAVEMEEAVPFLLENELKESGAHFQAKGPEESYVVVDGQFITGQNHRSTYEIAQVFKEHLEKA